MYARRLEWRNLEVLVQDKSQIDVRDLASNFAEKLGTHTHTHCDNVVEMAMIIF